MYFKYVIFSLSALLIQVINGQNDGSSFGCSCCCDTSIPSPVSLSCTQELGSLSGNAGLSDSITSCGNQSERSSNSTAAFTLTSEEESSCDSAIERYRRASRSNGVGSDGLRCATNLLKARLALAAATARAAASNEQQDASVVLKSVPVPAELSPPKLLHKQAVIGLSLSPWPINVPAPSCNCPSFVPSGSVANAVTISQKLGKANGNIAANITNCRCTDLPRPLPPKPPSVETCTTQFRVPDGGQTSTLAAIVTTRLAQHSLLTGQQPNRGQCLCSVNLPAPNYDCTSCGSRNNVNSVAIPSGGDFLVTSIGSEPPPSIVVETDVALSGNLNVCGNLPFVSAVQFDGSYDTIGSGSVSFGCDSESITNAVSSKATIDSYRSADVPRAPSTLAAAAIGAGVTQARIPDTDERQSSTTISSAAALFARLAQQKSLTAQQSNVEQCPCCISPSLPNCSSSSGSISSVITPSSSSLCVTSIGSESPGLAVDTDVALSGNLDVCGTLPFASGVQFQGLYDTSGSGSVSFGCDSKPEQTLENLNAASTTTITSCKSSQLPKYIPRALPTLNTVAIEAVDLPTKTTDADERQTTASNMAAVVSTRLAQHRLLTGPPPDCDCRSSVSPNFTPSNGGIPVTSISPEPPGIDVDANIGLFGKLNVSGDLPFQSAVQFQGLYETSGSGTVSFGCGDSVAITQKLENPSATITQ